MDERKKKLILGYFENLDSLSKGDRTRMKRSAGKLSNEVSADVLLVFYHALPYGVPKYEEEIWFLAGCIHCLWKEDEGNGISIPEAAADYSKKDENSSNGIQKRFTDLLDMTWAKDGYLASKLVRFIKMLSQKGYIIDAGTLIEALPHWNSDSRTVQKAWIRSFCACLLNKEE